MVTKYNLQVIKSGVTTDLSDYVTQCEDIPIYYERNSSWEPIISTFKFTVSHTAPVRVAKDDSITFFMDGQFKFSGIVEDVNVGYPERADQISVASKLRLLQNNKLEHVPEFYSVYTNTTNVNKYNPSDNWVWSNDGVHWNGGNIQGNNASLLWMLQCMFTYCGLTLDVSDVESILVAKTNTGNIMNDIMYPARDIVVDIESLWTINIDSSVNYSRVNADYADSKITMFDYVRIVCAYFGFVMIPMNINQFKLVYYTNLSTLNTNSIESKVSYKRTDNVPKYKKLVNDCKYNPRHMYYLHKIDDSHYEALLYDKSNSLTLPVSPSVENRRRGTITNISGGGRQRPLTPTYSAHWYDNLFFMTRNQGTYYYNGQVTNDSLSGADQWGLLWNDLSKNTDFKNYLLYKEIIEIIEMQVTYTWYNVLSNKIRIKDNRSIITKNELVQP